MGEKSRLDFGDSSPENSLMHERQPDFSGWATKANLKCSDGRTILPGAFQHQDKAQVPLVWQHGHNDPANVLGHAILEHHEDGVYAYGFFNDTDAATNAKTLVKHEDIKFLSIFANQLVEKAKQVSHGIIREVSLVLAGANPGALIDNIELQHGEDLVVIDDEAVIYTGELIHEDGSGPAASTEATTEEENDNDPSVEEVYNEMSEEQKEVVHYMVGAALESNAAPEGEGITHTGTQDDKEGIQHMSRNVFEQQTDAPAGGPEKHTLSHDALRELTADASKRGSLKEAVEAYALKHGITDIDVLFPEAKTLTSTPEFDKRRTEWVSSVLNGTRKSPFSRIKSRVADITVESARALGYIKGNLKKEEFFGLTQRTTTPTTVYKKQKLDRDDIVDITDLDVVAWLKGEMRLMLDEELARAVLFGDGREVDDEDKIKDPAAATDGAGIRSIANEDPLYAIPVEVDIALLDTDPQAFIDAILLAMAGYKGSGSPTFYTTQQVITKMLLARDGMERRLYSSVQEVASACGVGNIVAVEVLEATEYDGTHGVVVNLQDYVIGADQGGQVSMFDDFDIDYNQYKYLIETRISGALTKIRSALVLKQDITP
jgi:HK97 family phage prohead protease